MRKCLLMLFTKIDFEFGCIPITKGKKTHKTPGGKAGVTTTLKSYFATKFSVYSYQKRIILSDK